MFMRLGLLCLRSIAIVVLFAATAADLWGEEGASTEKESPWLAIPIVQANPKLGFAVGALGGYLHYFDEESKVSLFGVSALYTSTDSVVARAFTKSSFGADSHRVIAGIIGGRIRNDYDNFLGTGTPLKSEGELLGLMADIPIESSAIGSSAPRPFSPTIRSTVRATSMMTR